MISDLRVNLDFSIAGTTQKKIKKIIPLAGLGDKLSKTMIVTRILKMLASAGIFS